MAASVQKGSLASNKVHGESGIDHCERAWSDNFECRVLGQTAQLSIQDNYRELNHKP